LKKPNSVPRSAGGTPRKPVAKPVQKPVAKPVAKPVQKASAPPRNSQRLENESQRLSRLHRATMGERGLSQRGRTASALRFSAYSRRRRIVAVSVVTPFVILIALVVATLTTPLLAVENIKVSGTYRLKSSTVLNALETEIGTPLTLVTSDSIAKALSTFSLIESFAVIAQPPHTMIVKITERQPICIVTLNGVNYLYDPAGIQIGVAKSSDDYPLVTIHGEPKTSSHFAGAIDVLLSLPVKLLPKIETVEARTKDDVRMTLRGVARQHIVWGDSANSVLKSRVLAAMLRHVKSSLSATIDVSSPTAPVVRYGNF